MAALMIVSTMTGFVLVFAVTHKLNDKFFGWSGNYWEHMEWLFLGVGIGLLLAATIIITIYDRSGGEEMFGIGMIFVGIHAFMPWISRIVMWPFGYRGNQPEEETQS